MKSASQPNKVSAQITQEFCSTKNLNGTFKVINLGVAKVQLILREFFSQKWVPGKELAAFEQLGAGISVSKVALRLGDLGFNTDCSLLFFFTTCLFNIAYLIPFVYLGKNPQKPSCPAHKLCKALSTLWEPGEI